ncbi:hypothetical protein [Microcoleus sp. herbarium12]|jgi:hypothetical protein|uniref:hypothetical protein n=1 Tax=Microcoleus sp. herbarium12 TaxID=3055437 RepID=UPI002FD08EF4
MGKSFKARNGELEMKSLHYFTKILANCLLLISFACAAMPNIQNQSLTTSKGCLDKPELSLDSQNVKLVVLGEQMLTESGIVSQSKSIGYAFEAKANQKLTYKMDKNVCIWIFTPDNQLLNTGVLPTTGKYIIQVSAPQGSTTVDLSMGLDVAQTSPPSTPNSSAVTSAPSPENIPNSAPPANTTATRISRSNFPKASCGDPLPTNPNDYPVDFYPVYLPDSEANLQIAQRFCQDALSKRRKDSRTRAVQVAAFTSKQRAIEFRDFLNSETSGASIAPSTRIQNKP